MKKTLQNSIIFSINLILIAGLVSCNKGNNTNTEEEYEGVTLADAYKYSKEHSFGVSGVVYSIFDGFSSEDEETILSTFDLHNVFSDGIISSELVYHYELDSGTFDDTYSQTYFAKEDGFTYKRTLTLDNTVEDVAVTNLGGENVVFEDNFASPFLDLQYSNFVALNDEYILKPQVSTSFCKALTQQSISVKKASFTLKKGKFDKLVITTSTSASSLVSSVSSYYRFELEFNWGEVGEIPQYEVAPHESGHDILESALFKLNRSLDKNFTAYSELLTENTRTEAYFYATEEGVYSNALDSYGRTYGVIKQGSSFYEFYLMENSSTGKTEMYVYDEDPIDGSAIYPQYNAFAPELFKPSEDNKSFKAYDYFLSELVYLISPYTEAYYYASYATSLTINLDSSNEIENIEIGFYDYENSIEGTVTVSYLDIGETIFPVTISN